MWKDPWWESLNDDQRREFERRPRRLLLVAFLANPVSALVIWLLLSFVVVR